MGQVYRSGSLLQRTSTTAELPFAAQVDTEDDILKVTCDFADKIRQNEDFKPENNSISRDMFYSPNKYEDRRLNIGLEQQESETIPPKHNSRTKRSHNSQANNTVEMQLYNTFSDHPMLASDVSFLKKEDDGPKIVFEQLTPSPEIMVTE